MFSSMYGRDALDPRTERDLTDWLRSREPRTVSPTLWLRAYADLHEAAAHPAHRMGRFAGSMGTFASLAATVLILVAAAGFVVATGVPHSGIATEPTVPAIPQPPEPGSDQNPFPRDLLILVVGMVAAALPVLSRRVRGAVRRLAWGASPTLPPTPLAWLRPLRTAPLYFWLFSLFAAIGIVLAVWTFFELGDAVQAWELALWLVSSICGLVLPVVVAWRYPWSHRSSKWLIVATGAVLAYSSMVGVGYQVGLSLPVPLRIATDSIVTVAGAVGLAAGVAGLAGLIPSPSVRVAAASLALAFVPAAELLGWGDGPEYFPFAALSWVATAAWLSMAYVGLRALMSRPSLAWALLAAASIFYVAHRLGGPAIEFLYTVAAPGPPLIPADVSVVLSYAFSVAGWLSAPLLLAALAIGLRPVFFDSRRESVEAEVDPPAVQVEPD